MKKLAPVWLVCAALFSARAVAAATNDAPAGALEFERLFNGKDLKGWKGDTNRWSVEDGAIVGRITAGRPLKANTFLIWTHAVPHDFEMHFAYKITAENEKGSANSGVQYRSREVTNSHFVVKGYQADIEAGSTYSGMLHEEGGRGILAKRGQMTRVSSTGVVHPVGSLGASAEIQSVIQADDWNDYTIIARGNRLTHVVNGRVTADVTDEQEGARAFNGIIALQLHAGEPMTARFRELRIKFLK